MKELFSSRDVLGEQIVTLIYNVINVFSFTVENEMADDSAVISEEQESNEMNQQRDKTMTNKKHRTKGIKYSISYLLCLNEWAYGG